MSATEAQNNFGQLLHQASAGGTVYITKYDRPAAVVVSIDRYRELTRVGAPELDQLTREFDAALTRMQTDAAAAGVDALFEMEPTELGDAAVRGTSSETG